MVIQAVPEDKVTDDVNQPQKSSSKSSIKSKSSKTSLKSATSSTVSVKNETTTEVLDHAILPGHLSNSFLFYDSLSSMKLNPRRKPKMLQLAHQRGVPVDPPSNPSPVRHHSSLPPAQQSLLRMIQLKRY